MAGFYGNIAHSNKTTLTFDKIYHNRVSMSADDGVFINRYVLIDYDEEPVRGYKIGPDFYTTQQIPTDPTAAATAKIARLAETYYLDLATNQVYLYTNGAYSLVTNPAGYAHNYNVDVKRYGRGYDGTVWMKVYDTTSSQYKYVMVAELNTVVPNFHLVAEAPAMAPVPPWFDANLTNVDYYLHMQAPMAVKIQTANTTHLGDGDTITQKTVTYGVDSTYGQRAIYQDETYTPAFYYFKAGFTEATHSTPSKTTNLVGFDWEQSGRIYGQTPFTQGHVQDDIMSWYFQLPALGMVVSKVWDTLYTADTTRKRGFLQETNTSSHTSGYTTSSGSILGVINQARQYIGIVHAKSDCITNGSNIKSNKWIGYTDDTSTNERTYYLPSYTNTWTQSNDGPYWKDGQVYKVVNIQDPRITTDKRYTRTQNGTAGPLLIWNSSFVGNTDGNSGAEAIAADEKNGPPQTIYGAIAYINKLLGTQLSTADSRDDRTVIGLMNRMQDLIANIDSTIVPERFIVSDTVGQITTGTPRFVLAQQSTSTGKLTPNSAEVVLNLIKPVSTGVTVKTSNKWIVMSLLNTSTNPQTLCVAHVLTSAGTPNTFISPIAEANWSDNTVSDNKISIPQFKYDEAGHIISHSLVDFYLPNNFKTYAIKSQSTAVSELSTNTTSIVADNAVDTFNFATANKWIRLAGANTSDASTDDTLKIAHALSPISANANTLIKATASGWGTTTNDTDNELTIPSFKFDEAGHIIETGTVSFYLPHSFKTFTVSKQSTATSTSTGAAASTDIVADTSADTITFTSANKWLTINGDSTNDKLTFGHITSGVTAGSYGLADDETINSLDTDNVFEVPYFTVDEAGHITAASTETITIPESFSTVAIGAHDDTIETELAVNTTSIEADSIDDTFTLQSGNRWIRLAGTANSDLIKIAHVVRTIPTTETAHTFNGETGTYTTDFALDKVTYDPAGHITGWERHSYKMPYGYKTISVANNNTATEVTGVAANCIATSITDTLSLSCGNKWVIYNANTNDRSIILGHKLITASYVGTYGDSDAQSPSFGSTFKVPTLTIDEAGHVTAISEHQVTIPNGSLTNTDNGNVVTDISYTSNTNAIVVSKNYIGNLALTNYAIANASAAIAATDSINEAFGKVQFNLNSLNTAIGDESTARSDADDTLNDLIDDINSIISGDPEDLDDTGLIGRINGLENANISEEDRIAALEDIINDTEEEDLENPGTMITIPGLETRVDNLESIDVQAMISAAINDIFSNYEMALKAPVITISNTEGVLSINVSNTTEADTVTYQWQSRTDNTADWEDIQNATDNEYDTTVNEEYGEFHCIVTRTRNGYTSNTTSTTVTLVAPGPDPNQEPEPEPDPEEP